ncbi:MAG: 50S ribosomal protein L23 [Pseudomonadota bacterium]|nr:50S ribosomal protein L23 [Pseudomonadota bacterium]
MKYSKASDYTTLKRQVTTEKTMLMSEHNIYTFRVLGSKPQIKSAVEQVYGVKVKSIRTLNYKPEVKINRRGKMKTKAYKVAYVRLEDGYTIEQKSTVSEE